MKNSVRHAILFVAILFWGVLLPKFAYANPTLSVVERIDSELLFGDVQIGQLAVKQFQLSGLQLQDSVALIITGTDISCFSVSPKTLWPLDGKLTAVDIALTYMPSAEAFHTARFEISSPKTFPIFIDLKGGGLSPLLGKTEAQMCAIYARNGFVVIQALGGEHVEIYNVMGQLLRAFDAVCGENCSEVGYNHVVLVKIRGKVSKIVL